MQVYVTRRYNTLPWIEQGALQDAIIDAILVAPLTEKDIAELERLVEGVVVSDDDIIDI